MPNLRLFSVLLGALLLLPQLAQSQQPTPPSKKKPQLPPVQTTVVVGAGVTEEEKKEFDKENLVRDSLERAKQVYRKQAYHEALPQFLAVVEQARQMKEPRFFLSDALEHAATCYALLNHWDKAEATMLQAAEHILAFAGPYESSRGHAYLSLAYIQVAQKNWAKAERYVHDALAVYDAGVVRFQDSFIARDIGRSKVPALTLLGAVLREQKRFGEALAAWNQGYEVGDALVAKPADMQKVINLAIALLEWSGDKDQLGAWSARSLALREFVALPQKTKEPFEEAAFYEADHQYDLAIAKFEEAYQAGLEHHTSKEWLVRVAARATLLLRKLGKNEVLPVWEERTRALQSQVP